MLLSFCCCCCCYFCIILHLLTTLNHQCMRNRTIGNMQRHDSLIIFFIDFSHKIIFTTKKKRFFFFFLIYLLSFSILNTLCTCARHIFFFPFEINALISNYFDSFSLSPFHTLFHQFLNHIVWITKKKNGIFMHKIMQRQNEIYLYFSQFLKRWWRKRMTKLNI